MSAAANTLAQLALVALPVLVGFLASRYIRARRLDQIEQDALLFWYRVGYRAALKRFSILDPEDDLDRVSEELDAAVEQAPHPSDQPWLN